MGLMTRILSLFWWLLSGCWQLLVLVGRLLGVCWRLIAGVGRMLAVYLRRIRGWWHQQRVQRSLLYRTWAWAAGKVMAPARALAAVLDHVFGELAKALRWALRLVLSNKLTCGIVAGGVALIALLLGVGSSDVEQPVPEIAMEDRPEYLIGAVISLTGAFERQGNEMSRGYAQAIAMVNDAGGVVIDGAIHRLRLLVYDDESDPVRAREVTGMMLSRHNPHAVLAPYSSRLVQPMLVAAQQRSVPVIVPLASAAGLTGELRGVFQLQTPPRLHLRGAAELYLGHVDLVRADKERAANKRFANGAQPKVLLAAAPDRHSQEVLQGVREALRTDEEIVIEELDIGVTDEEYAEAKKKLAKTDALFLSGYAPGAVRLMETIAADSVNIPFIALTHCGVASINRRYPTVAEGALCAEHWQVEAEHPGTAPLGSEDFVDGFFERYGSVPTHRSIAAAAAIGLLKHSAEAISGTELMEELARSELASLYGPIKFDRSGRNVAKPMVLSQVRHARLRLVEAEALAQSDFAYLRPRLKK